LKSIFRADWQKVWREFWSLNVFYSNKLEQLMSLETVSVTKTSSLETTAYAWSLTAVTAWGVNAVLLKFLTGVLPLQALNGVRMAVASIALLSITALSRRKTTFIPKLELKEWLLIAVVGVLGTSLYQMFFSSGIKLSSASFSALVSSTSPIWVGLIGIFFGVKLTRNQLIGSAVAIVGVLLLTRESLNLGVNVLGVVLLLGSQIVWALYTLASKPLMTKLAPLEFTGFTFALGSLPYLLYAIPVFFTPAISSIPSQYWLGACGTAFLAQVLGFVGWFTGANILGAARVSVMLNITPVIGVLLAALVLHEKLTLLEGVAALVILFGVYLANRKEQLAKPQLAN
jgi:drug/metabolite transporter (DMT)-like permease